MTSVPMFTEPQPFHLLNRASNRTYYAGLLWGLNVTIKSFKIMVDYGCLGNFKPSTFFCQHSITLTWAVLRYKPEHELQGSHWKVTKAKSLPSPPTPDCVDQHRPSKTVLRSQQFNQVPHWARRTTKSLSHSYFLGSGCLKVYNSIS